MDRTRVQSLIATFARNRLYFSMWMSPSGVGHLLVSKFVFLAYCLGKHRCVKIVFYTNFHQNFLQCWVSPPLNSVFKPGFEPTTSHTVNHCPSATLAGQLPNLLPRCSPKNCFGYTVITRPGSNPTLAFVLVWGAQCTHLNGDQTPCHSLLF